MSALLLSNQSRNPPERLAYHGNRCGRSTSHANGRCVAEVATDVTVQGSEVCPVGIHIAQRIPGHPLGVPAPDKDTRFRNSPRRSLSRIALAFHPVPAVFAKLSPIDVVAREATQGIAKLSLDLSLGNIRTNYSLGELPGNPLGAEDLELFAVESPESCSQSEHDGDIALALFSAASDLSSREAALSERRVVQRPVNDVASDRPGIMPMGITGHLYLRAEIGAGA